MYSRSRTDANGKPIGEHGSYHLRDGSIHIDLNAGNLGQGVMLYTIAHEFTHFMEQQSPAKFQAFTDALFAELDTDAEEEIERKAKELKRQHPEQYRNASRDTLLEDARSEVVAEACETMLTDTDAAQRIGQSLKAKDATLFEKVKQWFRDIAAKLRKAYKGLHPDSEIAKYAKKTIQQVDGLVQMWADMAVDAAENYREGTGNENAELDSGVKMQLRYADGNSVVWIEENILKENDGEPVHQYIANYIAEHIGEVYTIIESGQKVYIGEDLPGEYTQSKYTKAILKNNAKVLKAKNRAAANLGEMIEIATNRRWEETKHTHSKDAKYGIYRYDTRFGFPIKNHQGNVASANVYNAELLIRNASDGKKYLYDIVSIKKDTASSDWLTKKAASAAANAAGQKGDVSRNSIRNTEPVVNQKNSERNSESGRVKNSDRDSAYMDAIKRGDMKTAQKIVEQAAKDSGYTRLFYHGSKKGGGFKIFRDWQYFTENKEYAKRYTDRGNAESLYTTYVKMDNPFDTRIAEVRKLFRDARMEYGMGELQENGLPDWTDGYDIADFIDENDLPYDSIVLDEGGDMVDGKPVSRGLSYVIRKSNQIKSADIITYDDSGNVIPLSQRFNTQNNDIRYSDRNQDQQSSLEKQNEKLREDVERLRELLKLQGKTTGGKLFKPESIKTAANFIMRETGRSLDADGKAEFADLLTKAYTALSDENVTYDDIIRECTNVAQWLDENGETKDALDEYAGGILSEMKGIPIRLPNKNAAITNRDKCLERNGSIFCLLGSRILHIKHTHDHDTGKGNRDAGVVLPAQLLFQEDAAPQHGNHAVGGNDRRCQGSFAAGQGVDVSQLSGGLKAGADVLGGFQLGKQLLLLDYYGVDKGGNTGNQEGQFIGDVGGILIQGFQHQVIGKGSGGVQKAVSDGQGQGQPGLGVLIIRGFLPGGTEFLVFMGFHKAQADDTGAGQEHSHILDGNHFLGGAGDDGDDRHKGTGSVADRGGNGKLDVAKSYIAQGHGTDVQQGNGKIGPDHAPGNLYAADKDFKGGMQAHDHANSGDHFELAVLVEGIPAADFGEEVRTGPAKQGDNGKPEPTHETKTSLFLLRYSIYSPRSARPASTIFCRLMRMPSFAWNQVRPPWK